MTRVLLLLLLFATLSMSTAMRRQMDTADTHDDACSEVAPAGPIDAVAPASFDLGLAAPTELVGDVVAVPMIARRPTVEHLRYGGAATPRWLRRHRSAADTWRRLWRGEMVDAADVTNDIGTHNDFKLRMGGRA